MKIPQFMDLKVLSIIFFYQTSNKKLLLWYQKFQIMKVKCNL